MQLGKMDFLKTAGRSDSSATGNGVMFYLRTVIC